MEKSRMKQKSEDIFSSHGAGEIISGLYPAPRFRAAASQFYNVRLFLTCLRFYR